MMNSLLLVDDRQDFIDAFTADCTARNYALYPKRSLAGLKELMPKMHHKVACVILDIKCLHTDDQEIEDASFITSAITYLDQNFPKIPRMILTGDDKEFDQIQKYYRDEDVFLKTTADKERLFAKIKYYVDNSDELRIRRENSRAFDAFRDGLIAENKAIAFCQLLKNIEDGQFEKKDFNTIRELLEDLLLWAYSRSLLPDSCIKPDGRPNLEWSYRYLSGLPVDLQDGNAPIKAANSILPQHISRTMDMVKNISNILSHVYNEDFTINTYKATLYGLIEILIWTSNFAKNKYGL